MCPPCRLILGFLFGILLGLLPALAQARTVEAPAAWCEADASYHGERAHAFAIHDLTLPARREVALEAGTNGGIRVEAYDGTEVRLCAVVLGEARTEADARRLADAVRIETGSTIHPVTPRTGRYEGVSVSFRLLVPRVSNLDLEANNGGIMITGVHGQISAETTNGGLHLDGVGGDVHAETTNGGLMVTLAGTSWDGAGLDAESTNGAVELVIPEGYAADLVTGTVNGRVHVDFPIQMQGELGRTLQIPLGGGGAPVRVATTNGGVRITRG